MKKIIFLILLTSLWLPKFQEQFDVFVIKQLSGVFTPAEKPVFSFKKWIEGDFQTAYEEYKGETFGMRNFFICTYNQVDFTLFRKPHGELVIGQKEYLFQGEYINEVTGWNFIGDDVMRKNIENIRKAEQLLDKKNIYLLTVIAPGKSDYFMEYLPPYYLKRTSSNRNYNAILKYGAEQKIRLIDLNKYFLQMKDTCTYPLFPQYGIHWNFYGVALAADSISKFIEADQKINLPELSWTLKLSESLQGTDYDLGDLMNIWQKLPFDKMAYPDFSVTEDSSTKRPRLLIVGDSFYWAVFNTGVFKKMFSNETYFYYCNDVHPGGSMKSDHVSDLNFIKEIEKFDVILLLQSSGNYTNPGVNFIQTYFRELDKRESYRNRAKELIAHDVALRNRAIQLSDILNISQDSSVSILCDSLVDLRFEKITKIKIEMRNNPGWLKQLYEKSNTWNKPIDQVMQTDAEWMVENEGEVIKNTGN